MTDSYTGYCPNEDRDDRVLTPSRFGGAVCFSCGQNTDAPARGLGRVDTVRAEAGAWDMTPMVEDMQYDEVVEVVEDAPGQGYERQVGGGSTRVSGGRAAKRRARAARLADLSRRGQVTT